ncbi:MAG TPA: sensor domain-containing diguanylate cyclase [Sulfurovum sp.]|nr:sensor domain-containing diguanylate cyclase [Sulfurovum sp.]
MQKLDYEKLLEENKALKHRINQFKNLLDSIPDPVFMKDENLRWIYGNPVILNLYSIDKDNYIGKTEDQLLPEEFAESCMESDRQAVAKRSISKSEEQARDSDDELHYYEVFKVPSYSNDDGAFIGLIGIGRDITERKEAQEALELENHMRKEHEESLAHLTETLEQQVQERTIELENEKQKAEHLAYTDTLTGLNNRRAFYEKSLVIDQKARRDLCSYAVIMLDVDNFKMINDTHGHAVGDKVLQNLARIITKNLGNADVHGRIGGDEFTITLHDISLNTAMTFAQNMCSEISNISLYKDDSHIPITASFGVSAYHSNSSSFEDILAKADEGLYLAKTSGRNKVISQIS